MNGVQRKEQGDCEGRERFSKQLARDQEHESGCRQVNQQRRQVPPDGSWEKMELLIRNQTRTSGR